MPIRCGNCGATHDTVAQVRSCHGAPVPAPDADGAEASGIPAAFPVTTPVPPGPAPAAGPAPAVDAGAVRPRPAPARRPGPVPTMPSVGVERLAGPAALGRHAVVRAGQPAPGPWHDAPRLVVDAGTLADPAAVLATLEAAWLDRRRLVVELHVPLEPDLPPEPVERTQPWSLDATFLWPEERLHHLVWANAVDCRGATPRWRWWEEAASWGATPLTEGSGEVRLPDGTVAWCDGGPLTQLPAAAVGGSVVHRIALERGHLVALADAPCPAALAPDQLAAVAHPGTAARIIAPAGSGKTRVLTERARHLLTVWGLPPSALTLVAFNTRAADELRGRTTDLDGLQIRTLNALALAVLDGRPPFAPRGRRHEVLDERAVRRILDGLVEHPKKMNTDPIAPWLDALSLVRLGLRDPAEVEAAFGGEVDGLPEVLARYREVLADRHAVDFDEQITGAVSVLLQEPEARHTARRACRLLLVDEFQDLAPAHLLLVRLLAAPDLGVFGVGDDDQTIYGYAGATPRWLIDYDRIFPGAGDHPLTVNYRCPPEVVAAADHLLRRNRTRVAKRIDAAPGRAPAPASLAVAVTDAPLDTTVERIRALLREGVPADHIAVLARVGASLAPVQVAAAHHGLPVRTAVDARWLERTGVRAALAWLRLAAAPGAWQPADLREAARRPSRGCSQKLVDWIAEQRSTERLRALATRLSRGRDGEKVEEFAHDLDWLASIAERRTTAQVLRAVRDEIGLDEAMSTLDSFQRSAKQSAQTDDLDALEALAELEPDPRAFGSWLQEQLSRPGTPDGVLLATVHAVKGREYPHVIVHDVSAERMPHRLSEDVEEERRVFHVAITRAQEDVLVVAPAARPSPFLRELDGPPTDEELRPKAVVRSSRRPAAGAAGGSGAGAAKAPPVVAEGPVADALRAWRRQRAKTEQVPPYVVFPDATLAAVAQSMPADLRALAKVPGFGPTRLERYGDDVLAVLDGMR